jgi:hypothetical protein
MCLLVASIFQLCLLTEELKFSRVVRSSVSYFTRDKECTVDHDDIVDRNLVAAIRLDATETAIEKNVRFRSTMRKMTAFSV